MGSHTCKALAASGSLPVVYDNLSKGHRDLVQWGPLEEGDILECDEVNGVFDRYRPDAVVHFAALSEVAESVCEPERYWQNNVEGSRNILQAMMRHGVKTLVFSSTCAVYGIAGSTPISEEFPRHPGNPYAESKAAVEDMLAAYGAEHGIAWTALRYFNAAGADPDGEAGEHHEPESHLIPLVLDTALGRRTSITVHGDDYPTPDGTCLRDYVHVSDLAIAHVQTLQRLQDGGSSLVMNLGSGAGVSVHQIIETARRITGAEVPVVIGERRSGDLPSLVCLPERARRELGWSTKRDIEAQVNDAWRWHQKRFGVA